VLSEIPAGWPPVDEAEGAGPVVPLFPLPGVFLLPGTVMPLHVFEPRYRQMVEESLDGPGRIVVGTVLEEHKDELPGAPPVNRIAGLGEIARHERLPDGRFLIWLVGLARVAVREAPSESLYRRVWAEPIIEIDVPDADEPTYRQRLTEAILERNTELLNLPEDIELSHLVDLLLLQLELPEERMAELFSESDLMRRAQGALNEHRTRPLGNDDDDDDD